MSSHRTGLSYKLWMQSQKEMSSGESSDPEDITLKPRLLKPTLIPRVLKPAQSRTTPVRTNKTPIRTNRPQQRGDHSFECICPGKYWGMIQIKPVDHHPTMCNMAWSKKVPMLNYKLLSKMKCSVIGRVPKIHQVHVYFLLSHTFQFILGTRHMLGRPQPQIITANGIK